MASKWRAERAPRRGRTISSGWWMLLTVALVVFFFYRAIKDMLALQPSTREAPDSLARGPDDHRQYIINFPGDFVAAYANGGAYASSASSKAEQQQQQAAPVTDCFATQAAVVAYLCGRGASKEESIPTRHTRRAPPPPYGSEQLLDLLHASDRAASSQDGSRPLPQLVLRGRLRWRAPAAGPWARWRAAVVGGAGGRGGALGPGMHALVLHLRPDNTWDLYQSFNATYTLAAHLSGRPNGATPLSTREAEALVLEVQRLEAARAWGADADDAFDRAFGGSFLRAYGAHLAGQGDPEGVMQRMGLLPAPPSSSDDDSSGGGGGGGGGYGSGGGRDGVGRGGGGGKAQGPALLPLSFDWDVACAPAPSGREHASGQATRAALVQAVSDSELRSALHWLLVHRRDSYDPDH